MVRRKNRVGNKSASCQAVMSDFRSYERTNHAEAKVDYMYDQDTWYLGSDQGSDNNLTLMLSVFLLVEKRFRICCIPNSS